MRNIYFVIGLSLCSIFTFAQSLKVTLNKTGACVGDSIIANVQGPALELITPASIANNNQGVMFDIVAAKTVTITGFKASPLTNGTDFEVYYRVGSFVGHETSSTGWVLLGSSSNIPAGTNINIGINLSTQIVAGQTFGFYVTSTTTGNFIYYNNGTAVGTTLASDLFLTVEEGVGKGYPFGSTNTTRNFSGSVLYEPEVTGLSWNVSIGTNASTSFIAQRSKAVAASGMVGGSLIRGHEVLNVTDVQVDVQATPASIQSGQSSTLSSTVTTSNGLSSTFEAGNNQSGAMFDVVGNANAKITGFSMSPTSPGADIEILYKTGSHVGFETSASSWTSLGTFTNVDSSVSTFLSLANPLAILPAQTLAFYITRTDAGYLYYTNGTGVGNVVKSDGVLQIEEGTGVAYPFGGLFTPRVLNTIVHYDVENPSGSTYSWSPTGGSSGSAIVSPGSTTNYTLTVDVNGCAESTSVTIVVDGIGLDDEFADKLKVYPNPANDFINLTWENGAEVSEILLFDLPGKLVYQATLPKGQEAAKIPVDHLAKGLCLLQIKVGDKLISYKVLVN